MDSGTRLERDRDIVNSIDSGEPIEEIAAKHGLTVQWIQVLYKRNKNIPTRQSRLERQVAELSQRVKTLEVAFYNRFRLV